MNDTEERVFHWCFIISFVAVPTVVGGMVDEGTGVGLGMLCVILTLVVGSLYDKVATIARKPWVSEETY